jgi:hypothetical protein
MQERSSRGDTSSLTDQVKPSNDPTLHIYTRTMSLFGQEVAKSGESTDSDSSVLLGNEPSRRRVDASACLFGSDIV